MGFDFLIALFENGAGNRVKVLPHGGRTVDDVNQFSKRSQLVGFQLTTY